MSDRLPIDVVPGGNPTQFCWECSVDSLAGRRTVKCAGTLPAGIDRAVVELIALARGLQRRVAELEKEIEDINTQHDAVEGTAELAARGLGRSRKGKG